MEPVHVTTNAHKRAFTAITAKIDELGEDLSYDVNAWTMDKQKCSDPWIEHVVNPVPEVKGEIHGDQRNGIALIRSPAGLRGHLSFLIGNCIWARKMTIDPVNKFLDGSWDVRSDGLAVVHGHVHVCRLDEYGKCLRASSTKQTMPIGYAQKLGNGWYTDDEKDGGLTLIRMETLNAKKYKFDQDVNYLALIELVGIGDTKFHGSEHGKIPPVYPLIFNVLPPD